MTIRLKGHSAAKQQQPLTSGNRRDNERGDMAVIVAVIAVMLLILIPIAAYSATTNQLPLTRGNQDYQSALAAAESGVSDFIDHLQQNNGAITLQNDPAIGGWVNVPNTNEYYTYTPSTPACAPSCTLTSTGLVISGGHTTFRTVEINATPASFLDYSLFYSNMLLGPSVLNAMAAQNGTTLAQIMEDCNYLYSQPNDNVITPTIENDVDTATNDLVTNGPEMAFCNPYIDTINNISNSSNLRGTTIGSNDIFYFNSNNLGNLNSYYYSTSSPCGSTGTYYWNVQNNGGGSCGTSTNPTYGPFPILPAGSFQLPTSISTAVPSIPIAGESPSGCYYTGPTQITFNYNATTMTVFSPESSTGNSNCATGTIPIPTNGVIYVTGNTDTVQARDCPGGNTVTIPSAPGSTATPGSYCTGEGTAIVNGSVEGNVTVGADNNIVVNGWLQYQNCTSGSDHLGLVAENSVLMANNSSWAGQTTLNPCNSINGVTVSNKEALVMAAVMAITGSFSLQNLYTSCQPNPSPFSQIIIWGTIASNYAGLDGIPSGISCLGGNPMKTNYDSSLKKDPLIYFPSGKGAQLIAKNFREIVPPSITSLPALP